MNYRELTNHQLQNKLQSTVQEERRLTLEVLGLLREVERRELFAELGFSSLFTFCTDHLKYSESAAQRRIVAMRALREMPELEKKIESGVLSLSVVALAQSSLRKSRATLEIKRNVYQEMEGLSRRKAEAVLVQKFDLAPAQSLVAERPLVAGGARITIEFSVEELREIEELRRLTSRPQDTKEMILSLVRAEVAKRRRARGEAALLRKSNGPKPTCANSVVDHKAPGELTHANSTSAGESRTFAIEGHSLKGARIPTAARREAWLRAQGQCEHRDSRSQRCFAKHTLEFDHVQPRAMGGDDRLENLRLLCRAHHRLITTKTFGPRASARFRAALRP